VNKNMNLVRNVKNKWDNRKFKKLEKEVIRLQEEISRIPRQQENSLSADTFKDSTERKNPIVIKTRTAKPIERKVGHARRAVSPHEIEKEKQNNGTNSSSNARRCKESNAKAKGISKNLMYLKNERSMKRSRKRCHFCRKRGHLQRNCLGKRMLRNWLRDEASEMYENTLQ